MRIKRLNLLINHLRTIASFPDYELIIKSQANNCIFETRKETVKKFNSSKVKVKK